MKIKLKSILIMVLLISVGLATGIYVLGTSSGRRMANFFELSIQTDRATNEEIERAISEKIVVGMVIGDFEDYLDERDFFLTPAIRLLKK